MTSQSWAGVWLFWILWFVVWEIVALLKPEAGDTLSEHVWSLLKHPTYGLFLQWFLGFLMIWSLVHFLTFGKHA